MSVNMNTLVTIRGYTGRIEKFQADNIRAESGRVVDRVCSLVLRLQDDSQMVLRGVRDDEISFNV